MQLALKHLISPTLSPNVLLTIPARQSILLKNVTWQAFESLLVQLGSSRAARLADQEGTLEIRVPLPEHEYYVETTGSLAFPNFPIKQIIPFIQSNKALDTRNLRLAFRTLGKTN